MEGELNFDDILGGESKQQAHKQMTAPKLTQTQARARQQSCMINEIDKDLLPSNSTKKPEQNFRMSLSNILCIDKNDESLETYKKQLLGKKQIISGDIKEQQLKEDEAAEVQILKVQIVAHDRPGQSIVLDFTKLSSKDTHKFKIKQGAVWKLRIHFRVKYDIVYGLKFVNNVYKMLAKVDKDEQKMGSFAPQQKEHVFDLPWQQAPTGFLARGDYKGKGLFLDNDGIVHCQFNYVMTIDKEW